MTDAKNDMARVGLFKEMGYISIGDKYIPSYKCELNKTIVLVEIDAS
jgi:hypothetical protein